MKVIRLIHAALYLWTCLIFGANGRFDTDAPVIGIDLGTTYSCVAVSIDGRRVVIPNSQGNRITPSYVAFAPDGVRLIGDAAKNQLTTNPENTVFDIKRIIGRRWTDRVLQEEIKNFPFKVLEVDGKPYVQLRTKPGTTAYFTPEEISAMLLGYMKETAESYLAMNVTQAVITVPASFNNAQRQATKTAAEIAGLHVLRIINEPTAAAMAFGVHKMVDSRYKGLVMVYDLGGGTLDVSLLDIDKEGFFVTATNGNSHLGGEDFERNVVDHFASLMKRKKGVDITKDERAVQKLRREVERVKRALSSIESTQVEVESLFDNEDFSETLTRAKFESLNYELFMETLLSVDRVLEDKELRKEDIDELVLVGGSTKIPKIRRMVEDYVGLKASSGVHPDEAVAIGAAIEGAILTGSEDIVRTDVTPFTLGIRTKNDAMSVLIKRNTPIPVTKTEGFTTTSDNQDTVAIGVYEGERAIASANNFLGEFELTGIPPTLKATPDISVTFSVNLDGILIVTAKDKGTGNVNAIRISNQHDGLSPGEIRRKIKEAELFAEEDRRIRQILAAKNELEGLVYKARNLVRVLGPDNLSPEEEAAIKQVTKDIEIWMEEHPNEKLEAYEAKKKELENVLHPISSRTYESKVDGEVEDDDEYIQRNRTREEL